MASQRLNDQIGYMYVNNPRIADAFKSIPEARSFQSPVLITNSSNFPKISYLDHILTAVGIVERT